MLSVFIIISVTFVAVIGFFCWIDFYAGSVLDTPEGKSFYRGIMFSSFFHLLLAAFILG